jgi:hypothetical protein
MSDGRSVRALVARGSLDAELAALAWILTDSGVPLVVASDDPDAARAIWAAFGPLAGVRLTADGAPVGGVVIGNSLEDLVGNGEVPDHARDLGVVLVVESKAFGPRVATGHYVRPIERDAAGHLQRRPPALLSAWNERAGEFDHFYWGVTDELATRAGTTRTEFESDHAARTRQLLSPGGSQGT